MTDKTLRRYVYTLTRFLDREKLAGGSVSAPDMDAALRQVIARHNIEIRINRFGEGSMRAGDVAGESWFARGAVVSISITPLAGTHLSYAPNVEGCKV